MISATDTNNHTDYTCASADTCMIAQETDIIEDIQTVDESPKNIPPSDPACMNC